MTVETASISAEREAGPHRSPALGVTAAVVVALSATTISLLALPYAYNLSLFPPVPDPVGFGWLPFVQAIGMLVGLVLAVIALITGRGRWWAAAAIVLAVLGSIYTMIFLESVFPAPGKGG